MIQRACVTCGKPSPKSYCPDHEPKPWAGSTRKSRIRLSGWAESARRKRVLEGLQYVCHVCGGIGAPDQMQVDHLIPVSEGGADDESNLAPIHRSPCHVEKTRAEATRAKQRIKAARS